MIERFVRLATRPDIISFVEKHMSNNRSQIITTDDNRRSIRMVVNTSDLAHVSVKDLCQFIEIEFLELNFQVVSLDRTNRVRSDEHPERVLNAVLPLYRVRIFSNDDEPFFRLGSGGRNYHISIKDVAYVPVFKDEDSFDRMKVGSLVTPKHDIPHHSIFEGNKYIVRSLDTNKESMLFGTVYIEDIETRARTMTYPKFLITINEEKTQSI